jgi:8-oxo-dGTP diphosphatase
MAFTYKYPRPALTVDAIIVAGRNDQSMILLILRKSDPYKGKWALPGGFANVDETLENACKRELKEETGLTDVELTQFYTFDAIDRDPRERVISTVFYGRLNEPAPVVGGDDALEARWFPISSLPEMAFDHQIIIRKFKRERKLGHSEK